jgi:hypothetical protein
MQLINASQTGGRVHAQAGQVSIKLCGKASQLKHLAQKKIEELNCARECQML